MIEAALARVDRLLWVCVRSKTRLGLMSFVCPGPFLLRRPNDGWQRATRAPRAPINTTVCCQATYLPGTVIRLGKLHAQKISPPRDWAFPNLWTGQLAIFRQGSR